MPLTVTASAERSSDPRTWMRPDKSVSVMRSVVRRIHEIGASSRPTSARINTAVKSIEPSATNT